MEAEPGRIHMQKINPDEHVIVSHGGSLSFTHLYTLLTKFRNSLSKRILDPLYFSFATTPIQSSQGDGTSAAPFVLLSKLPDELLLNVFTFLDVSALGAVNSSSVSLNIASSSSALWKWICLRYTIDHTSCLLYMLLQF